jgi:hypothetical protein
MTSYEAYELFLSIKMHFTDPKYDYFRYVGKLRANEDSFEMRKDKFHFAKLAKHKDPVGYLVAQYISSTQTVWVGDLFLEEAERAYTKYMARNQAITYNFKTDIDKLRDGFVSKFKVKDGQHPEALVMYRRGNITPETFTILNNHLKFFQLWDTRIEDTLLWPSIRDRCLKYTPFIEYDKAKIKEVIKDALNV